MSVELSVFSSQRYKPEAFASALAKRGWDSRIVTDTIGETVVVGWCRAWGQPPANPFKFDDLERTQHGVVALRLSTPDPEGLAELQRETPQLAQSLSERTSFLYILWTSANRSEISSSFQFALWHALAEATSGVLYNEMTGELAPPGQLEEAPPPQGPEILPARVGVRAPEFELQRHDGKKFSLGAYQGRPIVLWFIPSGLSCPFAIEEAEALAKHQETIKQTAILVALGPFSAKEWSQFTSQYGLHFPVLSDAAPVVSQYDGYQVKLTIVVDAGGAICDRFERGAADKTVPELLRRLYQLKTDGTLWRK